MARIETAGSGCTFTSKGTGAILATELDLFGASMPAQTGEKMPRVSLRTVRVKTSRRYRFAPCSYETRPWPGPVPAAIVEIRLTSGRRGCQGLNRSIRRVNPAH